MTTRRDLKRIIRDRQKKTGKSYTETRAHVMRARVVLLGLDADAGGSAEVVRADAVVLKVNRLSARVRIVGDEGQVTFRSRDASNVVPGHLVTLIIENRWTWRNDAYASGRMASPRIAVEELCLDPLPLAGGELKDLRSTYEPYRSPDPYAPLWWKLTAKPRAGFVMDPIAWGAFPGLDVEENRTCDAAELAEAGDREGARELLMDVVVHGPPLHRRARPPRQPRVRPLTGASDASLRDRHADR